MEGGRKGKGEGGKRGGTLLHFFVDQPSFLPKHTCNLHVNTNNPNSAINPATAVLLYCSTVTVNSATVP